MPENPDIIELAAATNDFLDHLESFLRSISEQVGRKLEVNKQSITFYERLMLLDLGTIALSVNAIIALAAHPVVIGNHKHFLLGCVITSWVCLLLSVFHSGKAMRRMISFNNRLISNQRGLVEKFGSNALRLDVSRINRKIQSFRGIVQDIDFAGLEETVKKANEMAKPILAEDLSKRLADPEPPLHRLLSSEALAGILMQL